MSLTLQLLADRLAICRLEAHAPLPSGATNPTYRGFLSITRTSDELSIVIDEKLVPPDTRCLRGYRAFRLAGVLPPDAIGILASLVQPLADARVPIFTISTHDTDYVLVRQVDLDRAVAVLQDQGNHVKKENQSAT